MGPHKYMGTGAQRCKWNFNVRFRCCIEFYTWTCVVRLQQWTSSDNIFFFVVSLLSSWCGLCVQPALPKSNRIRVTMCTFIIINATLRTHFISFHSHTHTHSHTQCMPVANSQSSAVFRCNKLSAKNLWCKMPSKRPAMTSSKCIVTVCLSACGLWRTRGAGNDGDNKTTTTRMKTEGKNKRHEHGTIFEFSVCASWQRQL